MGGPFNQKRPCLGTWQPPLPEFPGAEMPAYWASPRFPWARNSVLESEAEGRQPSTRTFSWEFATLICGKMKLSYGPAAQEQGWARAIIKVQFLFVTRLPSPIRPGATLLKGQLSKTTVAPCGDALT